MPDLSDDELLSMAGVYGIKPTRASKPKQVDVSDDDLMAAASAYGLKPSKPKLPAWKQKKLAPEKSWIDQGMDWARGVTQEQNQLRATGEELPVKAAAWAKGLGNVADIVPALSDALNKGVSGLIPNKAGQKLAQQAAGRLSPVAAIHDPLTALMKGFDKSTKPLTDKAPAFSQAYQAGVELGAPFPNLSLAKAGVAARGGRAAAVADAAATMGLISGSQDASTQYRDTGKIDPLQTALATGIGVAGGGALGGAAVLAPMATRGAVKGAKQGAQWTRNLFDEMGQNIGKMRGMKPKPGVINQPVPEPMMPDGTLLNASILGKYRNGADEESMAGIDAIMAAQQQPQVAPPPPVAQQPQQVDLIKALSQGLPPAQSTATLRPTLNPPKKRTKFEQALAEIGKKSTPEEMEDAARAAMKIIKDDKYLPGEMRKAKTKEINAAVRQWREGPQVPEPIEPSWADVDEVLKRNGDYQDPSLTWGKPEVQRPADVESLDGMHPLDSGMVAGAESPPPTIVDDIVEPSQAQIDEILQRNAPQEPGEFRYNLNDGVRGYERNAEFKDLSEFTDLPVEAQTAITEVATAGRDKKWLEDNWQAYQDAYVRKHGENGMVSHSGVNASVTPGELNHGYEANKLRDEFAFNLAQGTDIRAPRGIRTLGDAAYAPGKGFHQSQVVDVPDDVREATVQLLARKKAFDEADAAYKAVKKQHEATIYRIQDAYQTAFPTPEGQPPRQLQVNVNLEHPAGPGFGRVNQGVETYHQRMEKSLSESARAELSAYDEALKLKTTGGMSKEQWQGFVEQAADEADGMGQFTPLGVLKQKAIEIAKAAGYDIKRPPYKDSFKLSSQAAQAGKIKEEAKEFLKKNESLIKRGGVALGMLMDGMAMSQQSAEAADGKEQKGLTGDQLIPWFTMAAVLLGGGAGVYRGRKMLQEKVFSKVGAAWKDTIDLVTHVDDLMAALPGPGAQQMGIPGIPQAPQRTRLTQTIWEHMADGQAASWGVKFDNPEQAAEALMQFRKGTVTMADAMAGAKGTAFEHLNQQQRHAIVAQQVIRKSLAKEVQTYKAALKEAIDSGAISNTGFTEEAIKAVDYVDHMLSGSKGKESLAGDAMSGAMSNLMDMFFFWNPEHHLTNLTDQWIAGGSRIGVSNIARANHLLASDKELMQLMRNTNLTGGPRAERVELRANTSNPLKPQGTFKKLMSTDLPSDVLNADRVALGSLLEYAKLNKTVLDGMGIKDPVEFAKQALRPNSKLDPTVAMAARVHMTERMSRTLGVDPFRLNTNIFARGQAAPLMVFASQPARMARLMTTYIAEGNIKAVGTMLGITAMIGGRAAIPQEARLIWENADPQSYFATAKILEEGIPTPLTINGSQVNIPINLYRAAFGETNADKLGWSMIPGALGAPSMAYQEIGHILTDLKRVTSKPDFSPETIWAWGKIAGRFAGIVGGGALSGASSIVRKVGNASVDAANGTREVYISEPDIFGMAGGIPPSEEMKLEDHGMNGLDLFKNLILPGKPAAEDRLIQTRLEKKGRGVASKRGILPIPQTFLPQANRTQKDILKEMRSK